MTEGHAASECWWRYGNNDDDNPWSKEKGAYGVATNWYIDTGATNPIMGQLNKLTTRRLQGHDQVHNAHPT
jgi:hypothetical protein